MKISSRRSRLRCSYGVPMEVVVEARLSFVLAAAPVLFLVKSWDRCVLR